MKRYAPVSRIGPACWADGLRSASAEPFDWPQWQGPDRTAISKEGGLLKGDGRQDGKPPRWHWEASKDLGGGYSGPSIAAGKIYGMSNQGDDEVVWALSERDGKTAWTKTLGPTFLTGARIAGQ